MVALCHLTAPFLAVLFAYLLLCKVDLVTKNKRLALLGVCVLLALLGWASVHFIRQALVALPQVMNSSLPAMLAYLEAHGVPIPFEDLAGLKTMIGEHAAEKWGNYGHLATGLVRNLAFILIAVVVAISLFFDHEVDLERNQHRWARNYYTVILDHLADRVRSFYNSFERVMGAQTTISILNTGFTSMFISITHLPYPAMLIGVTFLCGLLPIIGNLISNTIIVVMAFSVSPSMALAALIYLVVIHKLEYFLNSKIIGDRIKNPIWLTLVGLVLGERLMGIPGMILAPVLLNFIKVEAAKREVVDVVV